MYQGKVCVVIGGAVGTGKRVVEKMAADGATVGFMDVHKAEGIALRDRMIETYGGDVFFFHGDAFSEEDVDIFINAMVGQFGPIDYLVNNVPAKAFML